MNPFLLFVEQLGNQLQKTLPGETTQFEMAHVKRGHILYDNLKEGDYKISAVLIFIYPNNQNNPSFLLIERPTYDGHHSAQIALPGGKAELFDIDIKATALREFSEETGCVEPPIVLGKCTPVYIPVSKFVVHPFVAYLSHKPNFTPDTREVAQLIECPISTLINPTIVKETIVTPMENVSFKTPYFDIENKIVWGATAMILNEFKAVSNFALKQQTKTP